MTVLCMIAAIVTAGVDLGIKQYVEKHVRRNQERGIWNQRGILRKVHNRGMMLNRLDRHPLLVQLASVFSLGILLIWQSAVLKQPGQKRMKLGASLMTGGAVSNTWDRLRRGYVVDYVAFRTKHKKLTDITFNLGDFAIFGGAFLVMLGVLFPTGIGSQENGKFGRK